MASAQVFLVTIPCSFDIFRCICISALSHNLLCPTAYFIWILKHKLKLGTHSIRGNLTKLLTQFVYETMWRQYHQTSTYFQICTSSSANGKHIFTRYLLYFDSDGLFFLNTKLKQYLQLSTYKYGRWTGGLSGRQAGGQMGRWAGGLVDRWAGPQVGRWAS